MFPIVNGTVHTIMYIYYIMSTFESLKPYLWWKKYVTEIQLLQFVILGLHFAVAALTPNCGYPRILSISGLAIACMFFFLFIAFYRETYTSKKQSPNATKKKTGQDQSKSIENKKAHEDDNNNNNNNINNDNNNINDSHQPHNRKIHKSKLF